MTPYKVKSRGRITSFAISVYALRLTAGYVMTGRALPLAVDTKVFVALSVYVQTELLDKYGGQPPKTRDRDSALPDRGDRTY